MYGRYFDISICTVFDIYGTLIYLFVRYLICMVGTVLLYMYMYVILYVWYFDICMCTVLDMYGTLILCIGTYGIWYVW